MFLERISTLNSLPLPHIGCQYSFSVLKSLKKLCASKGSWKAFRSLDYNALGLQKVEFLPPNFNGDVHFKSSSNEKSVLHFRAKLIYRMDKDNHIIY